MKKLPWACSEKFAVIDRTTAKSSARSQILGNRLASSIPDSPYFALFQYDPRMLPTASNWVLSILPGIGCPCRSVNNGFGSNESTCDTPPDMYSKITDLAFAG